MKHSSFLLVILVATTGCGSANVERIHGRVLLDNQPLAGVQVIFWPRTSLDQGMFSCPCTAEDGVFDVGNPGSRPSRAGSYTVLVGSANVAQLAQSPEAIRSAGSVPRKYGKPESSPLQAEIHNGVNDLEPLQLQSDPEEMRRIQQALGQR